MSRFIKSDYIIEATIFALYIFDNKATYREAAKFFNTNPNKIHNSIHKYVKYYAPNLYNEVLKISENNLKNKKRK